MKAKWIHEERADPGPPGADDVDRRHVTHIPDLIGTEAEEVDGSFEDPGVGLHDADIAGVHDTLDLHPDAWTHLTELELGEALGHQSVGIGDDPESDPSVGQGLQAFTAGGYGLDPQCCVRELTVDMEVGLLA